MESQLNENVIPLFFVNAFSSGLFSGNPAAVCLIGNAQQKHLSDEKKLKLVKEMGGWETCYVTIQDQSQDFKHGNRFGLRWFTVTTEVEHCGHGTLATAAVLFDQIGNENDELTFDTLSGPLRAKRAQGGKIRVELPMNKPKPLNSSELSNLEALIKVAVGPLPYQDVQFSEKEKKLLIRLDNSVTRSQLDGYWPPSKLLLLLAHDEGKVTGVILTLKGSTENGCTTNEGTPYDFVSRYFNPWHGMPEDIVTGSAHTVSAPYWSEVTGKSKFFVCQGSKRRGELWVEVIKEEGGGAGKVALFGTAFHYMKGEVNIRN